MLWEAISKVPDLSMRVANPPAKRKPTRESLNAHIAAHFVRGVLTSTR